MDAPTPHPAYPVTPVFPNMTLSEWIGAYMIVHVGSHPTRRWGFILWFIIAIIFVVFSICHFFRLRGGYIGALWSKWALRRHTWRNKFFTGGKPKSLMSNAQILTLTVLTVATISLAFIGPDYIAPQNSALHFRRFITYIDPKLVTPFQPQYDIQKAWWTSGNRTGILAFALFPLCILFALKARPFAIFAIPNLVQLHFDKLSWLHRWCGRLIWFITFLHVLFWVIQLGTGRNPFNGGIALRDAFIYDKFIYAWIAFILLTLIIVLSLGPLRQKHYETFYFFHVLLVPLMLIMAACHHPPLWWWCGAALGLWVAERIWRFVFWTRTNGIFGIPRSQQMSTYVGDIKDTASLGSVTPPRHLKQLSLSEHHKTESGSYSMASPLLHPNKPGGYVPPQGYYVPPPGYAYAELVSGMTTRITLITPHFRKWAPGQHFIIMIPSISRFTSHPFTCASIGDAQAPENSGRTLVFFIRAKNGWTKELWAKVVKLISRGQSHPSGERPPVDARMPTRGVLLRAFVDGPFGSVERSRFEDHSTVIIVAGGSGVSFGLSLLIYMSMCMSGRDGKYLGGHPGGWGMKGYRPTRLRFVWIVREFAHIVWCATAIRRCMEMLPGTQLQVDIFVTHFKRISDKKAGPPSPLIPAATLPAMDEGPVGPTDTPDTLYPPAPSYVRSGLRSRSSSVESVDSLSSGRDNNYVDLTFYATEYGDEERDSADPDLYKQNYILDLTNFEGENDAAISGEDAFNRRVMKTGKARRAKTRKATRADSARRELGDRAGESRGRSGRSGSKESSGDYLQPGGYSDRRRSFASSTHTLADASGSRQSSQPPSRSGSPNPEGRRRPLSEQLDMDDPMFKRAPSPFTKEFGVSNDAASIRELMIDGEDTIRLELDERELRDVSLVSEHARAGRPKFGEILDHEIGRADGAIIVTCCGPTSLNAIIRKDIAKKINPSLIRQGELRGSISLIADEFNY